MTKKKNIVLSNISFTEKNVKTKMIFFVDFMSDPYLYLYIFVIHTLVRDWTFQQFHTFNYLQIFFFKNGIVGINK